MNPSLKSFPKECPDCKSGNHKFWMFANQNLKQSCYKCLNKDCPREAYTLGCKAYQKKANANDIRNITSIGKPKSTKNNKENVVNNVA